MTRLTLLPVVSLAAIGLLACDASHDAAEPQTRKPISVTAVPATLVDTAERLEAGGIVSAQESALVSSRIVATIIGVQVRAGDRVRAGDILVTLDARDVVEQTQHALLDVESRRHERHAGHGEALRPEAADHEVAEAAPRGIHEKTVQTAEFVALRRLDGHVVCSQVRLDVADWHVAKRFLRVHVRAPASP